MQASAVPAKIPEPFASAGTNVTAIPDTTTVSGAASWHGGFTPINAQPQGSGGIPPNEGDFNGVLKSISAWAQWSSMNGPIFYDSAFQATIGGYPNGAILRTSTYNLLYMSTADNNMSNPTTGGANWVTLKLYPQFAPVAPQTSQLGETTPAINTTYSFTLSFTAPCGGFAHATSGFNYGATPAMGSMVNTQVVLTGTGTSGNTSTADGNPNSQIEFATCTCTAGAAVVATFTAITNGTPIGCTIKQNGLLVFQPAP